MQESLIICGHLEGDNPKSSQSHSDKAGKTVSDPRVGSGECKVCTYTPNNTGRKLLKYEHGVVLEGKAIHVLFSFFFSVFFHNEHVLSQQKKKKFMSKEKKGLRHSVMSTAFCHMRWTQLK